MKHIAQEYAERIVTGEILACKWEWLACDRHLKDLKRIGDPDFPYVFDETRADRIYRWYGICRHVRGPFSGQPIELQDWQKFDHGVLYGWVHKDTGRRRFKKAFHFRARGNVKSTENSAKCNYHMCADAMYPPGRPDMAQYESMPEVDCAAVDRGQARRVWGDARAMADASPKIKERLKNKAGKIPEHPPIRHITRGGAMVPLSKDTKNKDGAAPCYVSVDEYHAHPTSVIHDREISAFGKRAQSLMDIISTAGDDAENNPCNVEYELCCKILTGEIPADDYFVMIRQLDKGDNPHDLKLLHKANPILRNDNEYSHILFEEIKSEHDLAYNSGDPRKIFEYLTRRCNLWQAGAENKYMSGCMEKLKALFIPRVDFRAMVRNHEAYNGDDLSKTTDLTADAFVFRLNHADLEKYAEDHGCAVPKWKYAVCAHGFMPEDRATQHEHTDRVAYKLWASKDFCTLTPGSVVDYSFVKSHLHDMELDEGWSVKEICYDPYNATYLAQQYESEGYTAVEIRQGPPTLSEPTKKLRELILNGEVVFEENDCLVWCFSNAVEVPDSNGNIKLSKKHENDSQRIDLLAAAINACVRAFQQADEEPYFGVGISN